MIENFKITARKLKRYLKVSIDLPYEYVNNSNKYPLIITLNGEFVYNFFNDETKVINMSEIVHKNKNSIICALYSANIEEWRISEYNPYYNKDNSEVDTVLSYIFYEYIVYDLIPLLKERYRINDDIYLLGFNDSAISCLYMLYNFDLFKGAGVINPNLLDCNDNLIKDLKNNFNDNKLLYLYHGGLNTETKEDDCYYNLCNTLEKLKCNNVKYEFNENKGNDYKDFIEIIDDYLKYIL